MPPHADRRVSVASLNLHVGVDRGGRPYDVVAALASLDADVAVLQEGWWPDGAAGGAASGAASGAPAALEVCAGALGYQLRWAPIGSGRLRRPGDRTGRGVLGASAVHLDRTTVPDTHRASGGRGQIGVAVASRLPFLDTTTVTLDRLPRDHARRVVVVTRLQVDHGVLVVAATHMAHLSQGSRHHFARLRRELGGILTGPDPCLLAGDMNLWGTVIERALPGWRRAVVGRSWPARWPVAQPDHILVGPGITVTDGRVLSPVGSDHRPVRAEIVLPG